MAKTFVEQNTANLNDKNEANAFREGSFEIKTQAEIPVISKKARIVEEVVIFKEITEHTETVRDSVKRTSVEISEIDTDDADNRRNG